MSHIATFPSRADSSQCRYSRQAFRVAEFYTAPMALRIRHLREAKGWTQADLAARARISRSQFAMIESESRPANTLRLNAIAAALGVPTEALFSAGDDRQQLLDMLERLSPEDRLILVRMAEALAAKTP
jgi:transcriptional regulator with XRE-family HTH domain